MPSFVGAMIGVLCVLFMVWAIATSSARTNKCEEICAAEGMVRRYNSSGWEYCYCVSGKKVKVSDYD